MELLRAILNWIGRHRILGTLVTVAGIGLSIFIRTALVRSDGVLSEPLHRGRIVDAVYGIGTVTATRSFSIKPGVITTIRDLYVKEGDAVKKGALLANIDNVIYRAPFDGVVNFLPFKVGENIFTQLPALVVTDLQDRYIVVSMEQQGALRVKPGQKAKLSFDSIRNRTYDGVVTSVYSYNSIFLARIDIKDLPPEILPDMTADIAIIIRELDDRLVIPTAAIENGVVWVKSGHVLPTKVAVRIGVVDGPLAEVTDGELKPDDVLLIHRKLPQ